MTTEAVANFDWHQGPAKVNVRWGKAVYFQNRVGGPSHAIPLLTILNEEECKIVAYILRRYLGERMRDNLLQGGKTTKNGGEDSTTASLPIRALQIGNAEAEPHRLLEAQRLLNWSILILSQVMPPPDNSPFFFIRDTQIILPRKSSNEDIFKRLLSLYSNSAMAADNDITVQQVFMMLSSKILRMVGGGGSGKRKRTASGVVTIVKPRPTDNNNNILLELNDSSERVLGIMRENAAKIMDMIPGDGNMGDVLKARVNQPHIPIYVNENLSLATLFHAVGEILNTLFSKIVSTNSMMEAMHASIFHLLYLADVNLLDLYVHQVNMPVLQRLLFACFPDQSITQHPPPPRTPLPREVYPHLETLPLLCGRGEEVETWIRREENQAVMTLEAIVRILNNNAQGGDVSKLLLESELYSLINKHRKNTLEYYLIVTLCYYTRALDKPTVSTLSRNDRTFNRTQGVRCLWILTVCFYHFISNLPPEHLNVQVMTGECSFGNNPMYRKLIHQVMTDFLKQHLPSTPRAGATTP